MASPQQEIILHDTDLSIGKVSGEIPRLPGIVCHNILTLFGDMIRMRNHDGNTALPRFHLTAYLAISRWRLLTHCETFRAGMLLSTIRME